jgi:hypothetical protein
MNDFETENFRFNKTVNEPKDGYFFSIFHKSGGHSIHIGTLLVDTKKKECSFKQSSDLGFFDIKFLNLLFEELDCNPNTPIKWFL